MRPIAGDGCAKGGSGAILPVMGGSSTPDRWDKFADRPWYVQISVVSPSSAPRGRARIAGFPMPSATRVLLSVVFALAAVGAVVLDAFPAGHTNASRPVWSGTRTATDSPYRYPLGCMGASLSTSGRPSVSDARGGGPCWRYGVYVTAILRQVRGVWQLALEAVSPSCPVVSLPPVVRAQLAVCRRPSTARGYAPGSMPARAPKSARWAS